MIVRVMQPRFPTTIVLPAGAVEVGAVLGTGAGVTTTGGVVTGGAVVTGTGGVDRVVAVGAGVEGRDGGGGEGFGVVFDGEVVGVARVFVDAGLGVEAEGFGFGLGFGFTLALRLGAAGLVVALGRTVAGEAVVGDGSGLIVDDVCSFGAMSPEGST
jgi:hypothetical protein